VYWIDLPPTAAANGQFNGAPQLLLYSPPFFVREVLRAAALPEMKRERDLISRLPPQL